jgi:predicted nuclease with TOPRIM domain
VSPHNLSQDHTDTPAGTPDDPSLTSLISSSGIGPLRELVLLRKKQAVVLEQKDLEIEAMRVENAGLNDQINRLEGEVYKAKLETRSPRSSSKPRPDPEMAALISTNENLRTVINSQATYIKGLSEKCAKWRMAAAGKDAVVSTGRKEKAVNQPEISKLGDPASRQLSDRSKSQSPLKRSQH